jgi:Cys-tRNA(Pro) deacylase
MSILLPQAHAALERANISYKEIACDPELADTAAFCDHYGYALDQAANTIIVAGKGDPTKFACCIVLGTTRLDVNKAVCKKLGVKRASFATADQTRELTGMEIGGVTPFGIPTDIPIYIDAAVMAQSEVVMGGGNRSSKVLLNPKELIKLPGSEVVVDLARVKE